MKPFGQLAIAFICGIFIANFINIPFFYVYISCAIFLLVALVSIKRRYFSIFLLISSLLLGYLVYKNSILLPDNHIKNFSFGQNVYLQGVIVSDVEEGLTRYGAKKTTFIIESNSLNTEAGDFSVTGLVKVYIYGRARRISYGDEIILKGRLCRPEGRKTPGGFDHRAYLQRNNIYSLVEIGSYKFIKIIRKHARRNSLKGIAFFIREKVNTSISAYLPKNQASVLNAMLLGKRAGLSSDLKDAFIRTGTVHILAISGLHVGLIAFIFYIVFNAFRLNQRVAVPLIISLLVLYALITGSRIPVVRATIMISIMLVGVLCRRNPSPFNSLGLAAIIILLFNPKQIASPSFQLSFTAVLSILYFTPKIDSLLRLDRLLQYENVISKVSQYIVKLFSVSIAAWIGVLPLVAYYFHIISPIAIFGNLIVIPLAFIIIASSISFIFFSFFMKPLVLIFASATGGLIHVLQIIVNKLSSIPFAYFRLASTSILLIPIWYVLILAVSNYKRFGFSKIRLAILLMLIFNFVIWLHLFS